MTIPQPLLTAALKSRLLLREGGTMSGKRLVQALLTSEPTWSRSFLRTRVMPFLKQYDYIRSAYTRPTKGEPAKWEWQLNACQPLLGQHAAYLKPQAPASDATSGAAGGSEIEAQWKKYWIVGVDDQPLPAAPPREPRYPGLYKTTRRMSRKLRHKLKTMNRAIIKKTKEQRRKAKRTARKLARFARASSIQKNTKKYQYLKKFAQAHAATLQKAGPLSRGGLASLSPSTPEPPLVE